MKILKMAFASLLLVAITSAFTINGHHAKKHAKPLTSVSEEIAWTGSAFNVETGSKSALNNSANWETSFQSLGHTSCTSGTTNLCKVEISYSYTTANDPTNLTIQNVIDQVQSNYNDGVTPHTFPASFNFTKNGVTITVTIDTKA